MARQRPNREVCWGGFQTRPASAEPARGIGSGSVNIDAGPTRAGLKPAPRPVRNLTTRYVAGSRRHLPEGTSSSQKRFIPHAQDSDHIFGFFSGRLLGLQRVVHLPEPYPRPAGTAPYRFDGSPPRHFARGRSRSMGQPPSQVEPLSVSGPRVIRPWEDVALLMLRLAMHAWRWIVG